MIVKNEEACLANCLHSVRGVADEINIVDTGSTDGTREVAARFTDRVFSFEWIHDFAAARNFSFSKATKEYILWLDADDILTEENRLKFIALKENLDPCIDFFLMEYYASFDEYGNPSLIFPKTRLVRKDAGHVWQRAIHEALVGGGRGAAIDIYITHTAYGKESSTDRNFAILQSRVESGSAELIDYFYYGLMLDYRDSEDALPYLKRFIHAPNRAEFDGMEAYIAAHNIYKASGDYANALSVLLENEPYMKDKSEYYCCLGYFCKDTLNDLDKACTCFKRALHCRGTFLDSRLPGQRNHEYYYSIPYYALGQCHVKLRRFESALRYFRKSLEFRAADNTKSLISKLEKYLFLQKQSQKQSEGESAYGY
jgi:glycosyltransferase involved in cell wall biosynthesis